MRNPQVVLEQLPHQFRDVGILLCGDSLGVADESMESRIHREVYVRFGGEHPETHLRQEISELDA